MVELLTPHFCLFGAPFATCWRSGYELFRPPASPSRSATCDLTTLWVLCVCDHHFCVVRNHPCCWWCPSEFHSCRRGVCDRLSVCFEWFSLSNSVPRPVSFHCANTDSQMSLSLPCWIPWLAHKLIDCWFVTARKRRSSSRGYGNCFRLANAGVMPIWKPSWSMPHGTAGSFHKLRGQSHSRIVTQCFASTHLARTCTPVLSDLREVSEAPAVSRACLTNTFRGRLATLDGNWKGGDLQDTNTILAPTRRSIRKPKRPTSRPWSAAEIHVRCQAERALERAKACAAAGSRELAINYCLGGLRVTWGFTRPFAIRDQITDFMLQVDPQGRIRRALEIAFLDETRTSAE
jgi:hypothetical protein